VVEIRFIIILLSTGIYKQCKYVKEKGEFPLVNHCHERFWAWFSFQVYLSWSKV